MYRHQCIQQNVKNSEHFVVTEAQKYPYHEIIIIIIKRTPKQEECIWTALCLSLCMSSDAINSIYIYMFSMFPVCIPSSMLG